MKPIRNLILTVALAASTSAQAATPLGGLTIATSLDGSKLAAGGDTRTILVLDPETLEVEDRKWVEVAITGLAFNKDGSILAVQDSSDAIHLFSTSDWSKKVELPKRVGFAVNAKADLVAGHDANYSGPTVFVHSLTDGSNKASVSFPKDTKIAALALNADGTKLAVLTEGVKNPEEKEVPHAQLPKDIKGLALEEFKQKNDGKVSTLFIYEVASGKKLSEAKIFYSTNSGATFFFEGDKLVVVNYLNLNAKITPEGEVSLFQLESGFNYGIGLALDNSLILTGGLAAFAIAKTDALTSAKGTADKLPSWPEYWKGFSATPGGSAIYGATSGYRVFKLDVGGKVVKGEPVR